MSNLLFAFIMCIVFIMILYYLFIGLIFPICLKSKIIKKAKQIKINYKYTDSEEFKIAKWYYFFIITLFAPITISFLIFGLLMLYDIEAKSAAIACFAFGFILLVIALLIILYKLPRSSVKIQNGIIAYYDGLRRTYNLNLMKISSAHIDSNYPRGTLVSLTLNNNFTRDNKLLFNIVIPLHFENSHRIVAIVKSYDDYFHPWLKL